MPQGLALAVTWLVAVVLSTGIGLLAVNSVGDAASNRGPLGPDTLVVERPVRGSAAPTAVAGGTEVVKEFRYEFGSFTVACTGPFVRYLDAEAERGWTLDSYKPGPDDDVEIVFGGRDQIVEVELFCNRGVPDQAELNRQTRVNRDVAAE